MKEIIVDQVYAGGFDFSNDKPIKVVDTKKRGKKIALCTTIDDGFIFNLYNVSDHLGKFLDMEIDPEHHTLTLHFENKEVK